MLNGQLILEGTVREPVKTKYCMYLYFSFFACSRYECGDMRPFACTLCSYSAKQKNNLKLHMFNKHQIANFK